MEGNLSSGNMIPGGGSYGGIDLQGSMRVHHHQQPLSLHQQHQSLPRQGLMVHPSIHEKFPLTMSSMQDCDQGFSLADFPKGERGKNSASDEDEPSFTEDTVEGHNDVNGGKKGIPWQRVKWTDKMVRLLITAVSYIGEDVAAEHGNGTRRKNANLQKKGKWKSVSKVMAERGHCVSPQQCEDKFNDLNKRYKRLNEILGRGTSCQVVERPELLDIMDVSEKGKDEVRKILSSKHLFYEEMCSYHNGNRLHLPPDPELQRSLRLALRSRGDHENNDVRRHPQDDLDEDDQDAETDDRDEFEENHVLHGDHRAIYGVHGGSAKRMKQCQGHEDVGEKANLFQEQWMKHRSLQLEEQKLQIQAQMLELEKERFNWQRFCKKKDRELEMMRMENERMKL
ncbi:sequence-specific DNA binding transcription factor [Actinidia rufa]|uniref:Sequence-specific DNA binding transcription factor n=1 Tax=Actinidia rufa TaxID=165716 RepID=A0A7J0DAT4_9ERIC|nr:sequence-specific DNA binding transcription factor [Actinidia rufa]